MSDIEPSRDAETGQFTPSTEGLYGREYENAKAGYTTRKDTEQAQPDDTADPVREAAAELAASREPPPLELSVPEVIEVDPKEALTVQQAADEFATARADLTKFIDGVNLDAFAEHIDQARAEAIKGDPELAKHYGVEEPKQAPKETIAEPQQVDAATAAAIDATEGLDPETKQALKLPQVRRALETELARVDEATQAYSTALNQAHTFAQASFLEAVPELVGLPPEQIEQGLAMLARVAPDRFNAAMGLLNRVGTIQAAQQQQQQMQAQAQHQEFEALRQQYAQASDAALGNMSVAEKMEMVEDLVSYVGEYGISREALMREASSNLMLHHPAFNAMAADAIKYRRLKGAPAKAVSKPLPPVHRPGTAPANPRASAPSARMQALEAQLATARGDKAVRIASQIETLRRKSA